MGTLVGHVAPGLAFFTFGLWHLFNTIKLFCLNPNTFTSLPWFPFPMLRYLELYLIMFYSSASIAMELFISPKAHQPFDSDGTIPSNHLHNFEHAFISMSFLVYAVFAVVLDRARRTTTISHGLTTLIGSSALAQQLFLFYLHSTDHMGIEGQYHKLLQLIILVSLLTTLLSIALPKSFLVSFVRSSSIIFQGVWFIVMGYMIWTPSWSPKGCFLHEEEAHQVLKCSSEKALQRAKSLVNIEFGGFFVGMTVFVVSLYLMLSGHYCENAEYSILITKDKGDESCEEEQDIESLKNFIPKI